MHIKGFKLIFLILFIKQDMIDERWFEEFLNRSNFSVFKNGKLTLKIKLSKE